MDDSWEPENPVEVWYGGFSPIKSLSDKVFFKSLGLMQSHKKGKLIRTVAGVV